MATASLALLHGVCEHATIPALDCLGFGKALLGQARVARQTDPHGLFANILSDEVAQFVLVCLG